MKGSVGGDSEFVLLEVVTKGPDLVVKVGKGSTKSTAVLLGEGDTVFVKEGLCIVLTTNGLLSGQELTLLARVAVDVTGKKSRPLDKLRLLLGE